MSARERSTPASGDEPSLVGLARRFRGRVAVTGGLVVLEALIDLLFPLALGLAVNDLLADRIDGLLVLGALGLVALAVGSARRVYDTRVYARIYETIAAELVERERGRGTPVSAVAARTGLLTELVEFLEASMPMIVTTVISVVGILVVVAGLSIEVLLACLALLGLIIATYWLTGGRNYRLHRGYHDELERQVDVLHAGGARSVRHHFSRLMTWNRRLSDLETANYVVVWLGVIALLVYAPVALIDGEQADYGFALAALVYVFQYVEALVVLPEVIQQVVRLQEIADRLRGGDEPEGPDSRSTTPPVSVPGRR